ncbi:hypothetical protein TEA_014925 [Camellia sinensis var. sinensis]|uniref:SRP54-type proteins GTP-binding domain-containing protein n=1 Tax=Camellia sinensis var. sinensis TaxID=542762 RepID=A0A4S4EDM5_CAMSN|nr:hypothetical protein TEA_014925 [Camellia sinensis var. sinensis]
MLFNSFTSCLRSECIFNFPTFARFIRIDVAFILLIYPVYYAFEDDDINVVLADVKKNDVTGQPATAATGGSLGIIKKPLASRLGGVLVGPAPALIKAEVPWSARRGTFSNKDRVLKTVKGGGQAIAVIYFRARYAPTDYPSESATKSGGPNGSVHFSSEISRPENKGLSAAMNLLEEAKKEIDSYSKGGPIPFADLIQFAAGTGVKPAEIARQGLEEAKRKNMDVVIVDTAGRLQLKDDETEAPDGTMVGDDLQNHNVSNAGNDTVGKYFCYDLPVSEETGVWIPFVGEEKEMTMWDVVLDMLLVARGKVTALALVMDKHKFTGECRTLDHLVHKFASFSIWPMRKEEQISEDVAELGVFAGGSGGRGSDASDVGEVDAGVPEAVAKLPNLKLEGVREGREGGERERRWRESG